MAKIIGRSAGVVSSTGIGPWLYLDNGVLMVHAAARYFWATPYRGFRCALTVMWRDSTVFHRGRG